MWYISNLMFNKNIQYTIDTDFIRFIMLQDLAM